MQNKLIFFVLFGFASLAAAQPEHFCQTENILSSTPTERFVDNGDGTITDTQTDLMWKKCIEGLVGADCSEGEAVAMNWGQALLYMPNVNKAGSNGYKDWTLPNVRELSTLVESQCAFPAINTEVFPGTPANQLWTSSPYNFYPHYSWFVDFGQGIPNYDERIRDRGLRLVRPAN